uniref:RCC1-like domain-containing protein n=1 Tax=Arcella intermedia TaxID=1963864 RepID=A0A6B2LE87_9EUKA
MYSSLALTRTGALYGWGMNKNGTLGNGLNSNVPSPRRVPTPAGVEDFSCGGEHVLARLETGELFSWGRNQFGQLGLGHTLNQVLPVKVSGLSGNVTEIACGEGHCLALLGDGELYSWGWNKYGQLGVGHNMDLYVPTRVIGAPHNIKQMCCGPCYCMVTTRENELYGWGNVFGNQWDVPVRIEVFGKKRIYLRQKKDYFLKLAGRWPKSHLKLCILEQPLVEELLLICRSSHIPLDVTHYFIKIYLAISYSK